VSVNSLAFTSVYFFESSLFNELGARKINKIPPLYLWLHTDRSSSLCVGHEAPFASAPAASASACSSTIEFAIAGDHSQFSVFVKKRPPNSLIPEHGKLASAQIALARTAIVLRSLLQRYTGVWMTSL
jgi:hypothetical protein